MSDPVVPAKSILWLAPVTATGTLLNCTFSSMRLLVVGGDEVVLLLVAIPIGVLVKILSIKVTDPTEREVMSIPRLQLMKFIPVNVQPQSNCIKMAAFATL